MDSNTELDNSGEESTDTRDIVEAAFNAQEEDQQQETQEQPEEQVEQEVKPERDPWSSWKKDAAETMRGLPPEVQKHIIERQDQFHKGLEQYKEAASFARTIDKAITPYKDYLQQLGVTPEVAFPNLLKTERTLRTGSPAEKAEMFQKLAYDYGIDLRALSEAPYDAERMQLKQQMAYLQDQLQASQDFRQSHEDAQILDTLSQFGQQHEHFDAVRDTMADLLESGIAKTLDDAYAKAIRLNDDVFARQQQASQAHIATQKAQRAKQAAVQVKGAPTGVKNNPTPATTEDAVRMAMLQHGF